LKSVSRTRSGVGRSPAAFETGSGVRFQAPPMMRTWRGAFVTFALWCFDTLIADFSSRPVCDTLPRSDRFSRIIE
jgi:hypothetical protein